MKIIVADYYKDELFKFMPEDMFDLLDEAWFEEKAQIFIPEYLFAEFTKNQKQIQP